MVRPKYKGFRATTASVMEKLERSGEITRPTTSEVTVAKNCPEKFNWERVNNRYRITLKETK